MDSWTRVRKFCVTASGHIGWVPLESQPGDVVCVFEGSNLPYVLRPRGQDGTYTMAGHCFLHSVMFGEMMASKRLRQDNIVLQ
ncbi:hypothetical protein F4824DRAFT_482312 [Ustulina deusta]|nr:hypothetical protein F4824DRAFT_482312 [Ustulina deusta]